MGRTGSFRAERVGRVAAEGVSIITQWRGSLGATRLPANPSQTRTRTNRHRHTDTFVPEMITVTNRK